MRILFLAILVWSILVGMSSSTPEKYSAGIAALDVFLKSKQLATGKQDVVGMTGFYGQDQPRQWLILVKDRDARGDLFEFVVSEGAITGKRRVPNLPGQDLPELPLDRSKMKVDSDIIFQMTEDLAKNQQIGYDSVHYQLRCRRENLEPVWMVNQLDIARRTVGLHYISALTGQVIRSVWPKPVSNSLSAADPQTDGKPVTLLYGASVKEVNVSSQAPPQRGPRPIQRVISPKKKKP